MFCGPTFRFKIFGLTHMMNERLMGNWLFIILWYLKLPKQLSTMHLILQWISNISGILAHAFWDTFHTKLNGFWDKKYYLLHFELKFYHINIFVSINKCNFLIFLLIPIQILRPWAGFFLQQAMCLCSIGAVNLQPLELKLSYHMDSFGKNSFKDFGGWMGLNFHFSF